MNTAEKKSSDSFYPGESEKAKEERIKKTLNEFFKDFTLSVISQIAALNYLPRLTETPIGIIKNRLSEEAILEFAKPERLGIDVGKLEATDPEGNQKAGNYLTSEVCKMLDDFQKGKIPLTARDSDTLRNFKSTRTSTGERYDTEKVRKILSDCFKSSMEVSKCPAKRFNLEKPENIKEARRILIFLRDHPGIKTAGAAKALEVSTQKINFYKRSFTFDEEDNVLIKEQDPAEEE